MSEVLQALILAALVYPQAKAAYAKYKIRKMRRKLNDN